MRKLFWWRRHFGNKELSEEAAQIAKQTAEIMARGAQDGTATERALYNMLMDFAILVVSRMIREAKKGDW